MESRALILTSLISRQWVIATNTLQAPVITKTRCYFHKSVNSCCSVKVESLLLKVISDGTKI